jgi:tape measure domain-containing protein
MASKDTKIISVDLELNATGVVTGVQKASKNIKLLNTDFSSMILKMKEAATTGSKSGFTDAYSKGLSAMSQAIDIAKKRMDQLKTALSDTNREFTSKEREKMLLELTQLDKSVSQSTFNIAKLTAQEQKLSSAFDESGTSISEASSDLGKVDSSVLSTLGNLGSFATGVVAVGGAVMNLGKKALDAAIGLGKMFIVGPIQVAQSAIEKLLPWFQQYDDMTRAAQSLKFMGIDTGEINNLTSELLEFSKETGISFATLSKNIGNINISLMDLEKSEKVVKGVALAIDAFGGSSENVDSILLQLSESLTSGTARWEDFKFIMQNSQQTYAAIIKEITKMGLTINGNVIDQSNFREALSEGAISSDELAQALSNLGENPALGELAKKSTTFTQAWDTMKNRVITSFLELDQRTGETGQVFSIFDKTMQGVGKSIEDAIKSEEFEKSYARISESLTGSEIDKKIQDIVKDTAEWVASIKPDDVDKAFGIVGKSLELVKEGVSYLTKNFKIGDVIGAFDKVQESVISLALNINKLPFIGGFLSEKDVNEFEGKLVKMKATTSKEFAGLETEIESANKTLNKGFSSSLGASANNLRDLTTQLSKGTEKQVSELMTSLQRSGKMTSEVASVSTAAIAENSKLTSAQKTAIIQSLEESYNVNQQKILQNIGRNLDSIAATAKLNPEQQAEIQSSIIEGIDVGEDASTISKRVNKTIANMKLTDEQKTTIKNGIGESLKANENLIKANASMDGGIYANTATAAAKGSGTINKESTESVTNKGKATGYEFVSPIEEIIKRNKINIQTDESALEKNTKLFGAQWAKVVENINNNNKISIGGSVGTVSGRSASTSNANAARMSSASFSLGTNYSSVGETRNAASAQSISINVNGLSDGNKIASDVYRTLKNKGVMR